MRKWKTDRHWLSHVRFIDGQEYIVKQSRIHVKDNVWGPVCEVLISRLGHRIGINIEEVDLIPAGKPFPGKKFLSKPATRHTFIRGTPIRYLNDFRHISLCYWRVPDKTMSKEVVGRLLGSLVRYPSLIDLVAFDLITGNRDHHSDNIMQESSTGILYGIDNEMALRDDYCKKFLHFLRMCYDTLNTHQKKALCELGLAIGRMVMTFDFDAFSSDLHDLSVKARFYDRRSLDYWSERFKTNVRSSLESACKLAEFIHDASCRQ